MCVYGARLTQFGTTHPNSLNLRRVLTLVVFLSVPAGGGEGTHCISPDNLHCVSVRVSSAGPQPLPMSFQR